MGDRDRDTTEPSTRSKKNNKKNINYKNHHQQQQQQKRRQQQTGVLYHCRWNEVGAALGCFPHGRHIAALEPRLQQSTTNHAHKPPKPKGGCASRGCSSSAELSVGSPFLIGYFGTCRRRGGCFSLDRIV